LIKFFIRQSFFIFFLSSERLCSSVFSYSKTNKNYPPNQNKAANIDKRPKEIKNYKRGAGNRQEHKIQFYLSVERNRTKSLAENLVLSRFKTINLIFQIISHLILVPVI